jgi:hypothetical protein
MNEPRQNCFVFNTLIAFLAFLPCSDLKAQDELDQRAPSPAIASASAATKPTPKPLFQENFNDGSADGMAALSGTWSVVDGQLNVVPGSPSLIDKVLVTSDFRGNIAASVKTTHVSGYTSTGILLRYTDSQHYYEIAFDSFSNSIQALPPRSLLPQWAADRREHRL